MNKQLSTFVAYRVRTTIKRCWWISNTRRRRILDLKSDQKQNFKFLIHLPIDWFIPVHQQWLWKVFRGPIIVRWIGGQRWGVGCGGRHDRWRQKFIPDSEESSPEVDGKFLRWRRWENRKRIFESRPFSSIGSDVTTQEEERDSEQRWRQTDDANQAVIYTFSFNLLI